VNVEVAGRKTLDRIASPRHYIRSGYMEPLTPAVFHVLLSLVDEPRHGYGIMQEVARTTEGGVNMGPGTLYGTLQRMCDAGLVEDCPRSDLRGPEERRRYYRLTKKGQAAAVAEAERLERLLSSAYNKTLIPRPGTG
jgi:DNA-binding PadR family transcriptional regulator